MNSNGLLYTDAERNALVGAVDENAHAQLVVGLAKLGIYTRVVSLTDVLSNMIRQEPAHLLHVPHGHRSEPGDTPEDAASKYLGWISKTLVDCSEKFEDLLRENGLDSSEIMQNVRGYSRLAKSVFAKFGDGFSVADPDELEVFIPLQLQDAAFYAVGTLLEDVVSANRADETGTTLSLFAQALGSSLETAISIPAEKAIIDSFPGLKHNQGMAPVSR